MADGRDFFCFSWTNVGTNVLNLKSTQVTLFSSLASLFNVFDPTSGTQIGSVAGFVCITSAELDLQVSQEKNFATSLLQSFHPQCSVDGVCSVVMVAAQQFLFSVNRLFKDIHIRENIETYTVFKKRERERCSVDVTSLSPTAADQNKPNVLWTLLSPWVRPRHINAPIEREGCWLCYRCRQFLDSRAEVVWRYLYSWREICQIRSSAASVNHFVSL